LSWIATKRDRKVFYKTTTNKGKLVKTPGSQMGSLAAAEEGGEEIRGGRWESGERTWMRFSTCLFTSFRSL